MKRKLHRYLMAACAAWGLVGCFHDELDCGTMPNVEVAFRYVHNMSGRDLFAEQVRKVTVLVFDGEGVYRGIFTDQGTALAAPGYTMQFQLPAGTYTLLAWGGRLDTYDLTRLETGVSTLADFLLRANGLPTRSGTQLNIPDLDDLFHGLYGRLEVKSGQTARATIDLIKDTNTILVNVTGLDYIKEQLPAASDPSPFEVEIMADNGLYRSDNTLRQGEFMFGYLPISNINRDYTLASSTRTLRLMIGNEVRLRVIVRSSGRVLRSDDVIELITDNPDYVNQSEIDRQDVFRFDYRISGTTVSISVNGWTVIDAIPLL